MLKHNTPILLDCNQSIPLLVPSRAMIPTNPLPRAWWQMQSRAILIRRSLEAKPTPNGSGEFDALWGSSLIWGRKPHSARPRVMYGGHAACSDAAFFGTLAEDVCARGMEQPFHCKVTMDLARAIVMTFPKLWRGAMFAFCPRSAWSEDLE